MVTSVVLNCGQNYTIMVTWVVPNCAPNYATMVTFFQGPKNNESLWSTAERHSYGRIGCKKLQEAPKAKCPNNQHALKSEPTNQTRPLLQSGKHKREPH
jgi:hypothetical protein